MVCSSKQQIGTIGKQRYFHRMHTLHSREIFVFNLEYLGSYLAIDPKVEHSWDTNFTWGIT